MFLPLRGERAGVRASVSQIKFHLDEAPSAKLQHPEKHQTSTSNWSAIWGLELGASLVLGGWGFGAFRNMLSWAQVETVKTRPTISLAILRLLSPRKPLSEFPPGARNRAHSPSRRA